MNTELSPEKNNSNPERDTGEGLEVEIPVDETRDIFESNRFANFEAINNYLPEADDIVDGAAEFLNMDSDTSIGEKLVSRLSTNMLANQQDSYYERMLEGPIQNDYEPGPHRNRDGSSFEVDADGKITSFTHPELSIKGKPMTLVYGELKYDQEGNLNHLKSPWGYTLSRISEVDDNGVATWQCRENGRPKVYAGAGSDTFKANITVDENGFRNLIADGKYKGFMFARSGDGSLVTSSPVFEGGQQTGIKTEITTPELKKQTRSSSFDEHNRLSADQLLAANSPEQPQERTKAQEILDKAREEYRKLDDPIKNITDAIKQFESVESFDLSRGRNGSFSVDIELDGPKCVPSDMTSVVSKHRSVNSRLSQSLSFDFTPKPNIGGFSLTNMQGFRSTVEKVQGLFGRGNQRVANMHDMTMGRKRDGTGYLEQTSGTGILCFYVTKSTTLDSSDFRQGSPMNNFLRDPKALNGLEGAMELFQRAEGLERISMRREGDDRFQLTVGSRNPRNIELDGVKAGPVKVDSVDLDKELTFTVSQGEDGPDADQNPDSVAVDQSGITLNIAGAKINPEKVTLKRNAQGESVVEIEIETAKLKEKAGLKLTTKDLETLDTATLKLNIPVVNLLIDQIEKSTKR